MQVSKNIANSYILSLCQCHELKFRKKNITRPKSKKTSLRPLKTKKFTWKYPLWKRRNIYKPAIVGFHIRFRGCTSGFCPSGRDLFDITPTSSHRNRFEPRPWWGSASETRRWRCIAEWEKSNTKMGKYRPKKQNNSNQPYTLWYFREGAKMRPLTGFH